MTPTATLDTATLDLLSLHIVQRGGFDADGVTRERGEVLNTSSWRNHQALVNTRVLAPATYTLHETMVECGCGRRWENQEYANIHICPVRMAAEEERAAKVAAAKARASAKSTPASGIHPSAPPE